jgi:hypothetical protein
MEDLTQREQEMAEISEAIRNIERANRAMARLFNLEESEDDE